MCAAGRGSDDRQRYVVARTKEAFALLNRYPYTNGHVMIVPRRHVGQLKSLRPTEWAAMLKLAQQLIARLETAVHPQGFNVGLNLGRVAGAGVPGHLHLHLVPRWRGDTNFMPLLGGTRVISRSLDELYRLLTRPNLRKRT